MPGYSPGDHKESNMTERLNLSEEGQWNKRVKNNS